MHCYDYPRPSVTVDAVLFGFDGKGLNVLLIRRKKDPFKDKWAFPGGFLEMDESCEAAVARELYEETGISDIPFTQFKVFSAPARDPRGRVLSVAFIAMVDAGKYSPKGGDDAEEAQWVSIDDIPSLAFDHHEILSEAKIHLINIARCEPIGLGVLPDVFTFNDLHILYEGVFGRVLNSRTLQRKLMRYQYLVKAEEIDTSRKLSAKLMRFDEEIYFKVKSTGFVLDI